MADGDGKWVVDHATEFVRDGLQNLDELGDHWGSVLESTMSKIAALQLPAISDPPKTSLPVPEYSLGKVGTAPKPHLGSLTIAGIPSAPSLSGLLKPLDLSDLDKLGAAPVAPPLSIPDAPTMANIPAPDRPAVDMALTLPAAPTIDLPTLDALQPITLPAFTFPTLPTFQGVPPTIDFAAPDLFIDWTEPEYKSELADELTALVREWFKGGTGLPAPVEEALFRRTRDRDSIEGRRRQQEAIDVWAARGYEMPPGMLNKQVQAILDENRTKAGETNRDVLIEATKWEIENIRFAVQQGMALEQLLANIFENGLKRKFEVVRFQAESKLNLFNAQVGLFNARSQLFSNFQQLYRTQLDGALAHLQAYKTAVDGQVAVGQINQQHVEVYKAKFEGVRASVDVYKSLMQGAQLELEGKKTLFDAYKTDVQAFGELIGAEKTKFDAYDSRVKAETSKAGMYEATARAYGATVSAATAKTEAKSKAAELSLQMGRVMVDGYQAELEGWRARLTADRAQIDTELAAFQAELEGWRAGTQLVTTQAEMQSRYADMQVRTNIAFSEMQQKAYDAKMTRMLQEANFYLEKFKAVGAYATQLAAGAMSAANISASVQGSGSISESFSISNSTNKNYNYTS